MGVVTIQGCGLAGVFLGWQLWKRGVAFRHLGEHRVGASHAAAGLVNPVTGKGMNVGWRLDEFLAEMGEFYDEVEALLGAQYFFRLPVLRVFTNEAEKAKFLRKKEGMAQWVGAFSEHLPDVKGGEAGGVEWLGGGWLNVRAFLKDSLAFFESWSGGATSGVTVLCEGARGLRSGDFAYLPTRLAKGEILEISVPDWGESRILNRRGWSIPIGEDVYRVGATYEWDDLTDEPTPSGREKLERLVREFTDRDFTIRNHVAGVRPIVRNSEPVIGRHPTRQNLYLINGLGSKGCLYGPAVARALVELLLDGKPVDPQLDVAVFSP